MFKVLQIGDGFIEENTVFSELIAALGEGFSNADIMVPMRHHHDFPNPEVGADSTLLLMPAWNPSNDAGVKMVTVSPENGRFGLPSIQGVYILMDTTKGGIKALLEAKSLTVKRTAAASALASAFLSRKDAKSMLMVGTGALAPNLIKAHASIRPLEKVYIWGRDPAKAKDLVVQLKNESFETETVIDIAEKIEEVDIVSCATLSKTPLILGQHIREGQHIDLVGAYRTDMREGDDDLITKASVFVDTFQGGLKESGDIVQPIKKGILKKEEVRSDLFGLCSGSHRGRSHGKEITLFKSVGHALEDLVAAGYYYNKYTDGKHIS